MFKRCPLRGCGYRTNEFSQGRCPQCGQDLVIQLESGDRLESWVIEESLAAGKGGMATVYRARHASRPGDVAFKIAHGKAFQFDALPREADCLAQLDHPNIVKILPLGNEGNQKSEYCHKIYLMGEPLAFLVLQWIPGGSLRDYVSARGGRLSVEEAVRLASTLAEALTHVHDRHVIHLDIKPSNIMLDESTGQPVLMDFGIARRLDIPSKRIRERNLGTPGYMAPEHIKESTLDARADVFSLGVVLYELLSGMQGGPFRRARTEETRSATIEQLHPSVTQHNLTLDSRWDGFFARALAKRPEDRFQSMDEFRAALAGFAAERPQKKRMPLIPIAVGGFAISVVGVALAVWPRPDPPILTPTPTLRTSVVVTTVLMPTATPTPQATWTPQPSSTTAPSPTPTAPPTTAVAPSRTPSPKKATSTLAPATPLAIKGS